MVIRRLALVVAAGLAILVTVASPAAADRDLAISVGRITVDQVQLVAAIPVASPSQLPAVTVSRDGWVLPSTVEMPGPGAAPEVNARTVMAVVDTSAAMGDATLDAAKSGLLAFADTAPADVAIGLVAAAGNPAVVVHPTRDRAALRAGAEKLQTAGDTAIYAGVRTATGQAAESEDRQVLVIAGSRDTADNAAEVIGDLGP
ncbi:MAG TPA: VWA domain-containing protein, partial [Jiangellales bacterium]|nr:VWA domain-containing protein [Jiangellales bacterium]